LRLMRAYGDIAGTTQNAGDRLKLLERARRVPVSCAERLPKDELVKLQQRLAALEAAISPPG